MEEDALLDHLRKLRTNGVIKRIGVVVHHHALGYQANAMVVWDVPDGVAREAGLLMQDNKLVSLCYLRKRVMPDWPYNFYCMIHGREEEETRSKADLVTRLCDLTTYPRQILFSKRRFRQYGARYFTSSATNGTTTP
ncbi:MAG: AsnC family protein [Magnetococcales bacterium]|nr:AsnC family protein [Magnetococcales bacterium]